MNDRLTAFLDILGFREEIKSGDRLGALTELIREIGTSGLLGAPGSVIDIDRGEIRVPAKATAFSDHIVISLLKSDLDAASGGSAMTLGMMLLERRIRKFATEAARYGLLIRGGIVLGQLVHEDAAILGNAMIEAYELESEIANYPRIVIAKSVCSAVNHPQRMLLRDQDGIVHFNYFQALREDERLGELPRCVENKIASFNQPRDLRKLAKWTWFKKHLDLAYSDELPYY